MTTSRTQSGLLPIGTKVCGNDGFTLRVGQVAEHTTDKWGTWHVVAVAGKFEKVGHIGDAGQLGIGWKVWTARDGRHGDSSGPAYTGD